MARESYDAIVIGGHLGDYLAAFDINPLIRTPAGPVAVDALAVPVLLTG